MASQVDITRLLTQVNHEHQELWSEIIPQIYPELIRITRVMRGHKASQLYPTLDTQAVLSEAFASLYDSRQIVWRDRKHFFLTFAQACRYVITIYDRVKHSQKRGGGFEFMPIDLADIDYVPDDMEWFLALDLALNELEHVHQRAWEGVLLRFYTGLTEAEIADLQQVSVRTVARDWIMARAFLSNILSEHA